MSINIQIASIQVLQKRRDEIFARFMQDTVDKRGRVNQEKFQAYAKELLDIEDRLVRLGVNPITDTELN
jgi:hypothetical protein